MKRFLILTSMLLISATLAFGQKQAAKQTSTSASSKGTASGNSSVGSNGLGAISTGTLISGELQNTLDVRKAAVGDQVVVKTISAIKQNGQTVIPKGTNLIGHVTEVAQRTKQNATSRLGVVFDRLQNKSLDMPITASIVSLTNAAASGTVDNFGGFDMSGSSGTSASASRGNSGGGGGLLGGVGGAVGGAVNTVGNTAGSVLNTATQTTGSLVSTAGQTVGNTAGGVGNIVNGIQISGSASGSAGAGTTLSSGDKNIRIEKGAGVVLRFNGSPQGQ